MTNRIIESMTSVTTETGWTVRVWWTEATVATLDGWTTTMHTTITDAVRAASASPETIRAAIEGLNGAGVNLAAFEIKDVFGNGVVVYPDWK